MRSSLPHAPRVSPSWSSHSQARCRIWPNPRSHGASDRPRGLMPPPHASTPHPAGSHCRLARAGGAMECARQADVPHARPSPRAVPAASRPLLPRVHPPGRRAPASASYCQLMGCCTGGCWEAGPVRPREALHGSARAVPRQRGGGCSSCRRRSPAGRHASARTHRVSTLPVPRDASATTRIRSDPGGPPPPSAPCQVQWRTPTGGTPRARAGAGALRRLSPMPQREFVGWRVGM